MLFSLSKILFELLESAFTNFVCIFREMEAVSASYLAFHRLENRCSAK